MFLRFICVFLFLVISLQPALSAEQKVKNIILFIGDGMHLEHEIAASRYLSGRNASLVWQSFPYLGFVSTWDVNTYNKYALDADKKPFSYNRFFPTIGYNPDRGGLMPYPLQEGMEKEYFLADLECVAKGDYSALATDSAAAATALATGIKTAAGNISWLPGDLQDGKLKTIMELAREQKGTSIGVVTTVPFNHATPAGFLAHNTSRKNYYTKQGSETIGIAEEIIKLTKPDVVIGGGHPKYTKELFFQDEKFLSDELYKEFMLSEEYVTAEKRKGIPAAVSLSKAAQMAVNNDMKLFGLFGGARGSVEYPEPVHSPDKPRINKDKEDPSLTDMVYAALTVLSENENGFFLMAEQGTIDWANHDNDYKGMVGCVAELNAAVSYAVQFVEKPGDDINWDNTLLIVTSDHANSYMRIKGSEVLCKGCLPKQIKIFGKSFYPGDEVKYATDQHTNELVNLYVKGNNTKFFEDVENFWYPGTRIIDNTHIFDALIKAIGINYDKTEVLEEEKYKLPDFNIE